MNKHKELYEKASDAVHMIALITDDGKRLKLDGYAEEGIGIFDYDGNEYPAGISENGEIYGSQVDNKDNIFCLDGESIVPGIKMGMILKPTLEKTHIKKFNELNEMSGFDFTDKDDFIRNLKGITLDTKNPIIGFPKPLENDNNYNDFSEEEIEIKPKKIKKSKKIKKFNESLRDSMKPKSNDDILSSLMKLTPNGMLWYLGGLDFDENDEKIYKDYVNIATKRIEDAEKELDEIFNEYQDNNLNELVDEVCKWVTKNGGNAENIIGNGLKTTGEMLEDGYREINHHMWQQLYSEQSVKLFCELLKQIALDETTFNNIDGQNN
jgi:hypothetical protein